MELTAVLTPAEKRGFVALNPETGTTLQGETVEEAVAQRSSEPSHPTFRRTARRR